MKTVALIVAAGKGERAGGGLPKQFARLGAKAVLAWSVEAFAAHPDIDATYVVVGEGQDELLTAALRKGTVPFVYGGATRQDSVRAGLERIAADGAADRVLIHDAARPFFPAAVIDRLLAALEDADGAVPVLPVADTLARYTPPTVRAEPVEALPFFAGHGVQKQDGPSTGSGRTELGEVVERSDLFRVQTPQAFRFDAIMTSHASWFGPPATDDAQMARGAGFSVATVDGDAALDKITHPADFVRAEAMLAACMTVRTGMGFDVHRLEAGRPLWLGGIEIAHAKGLAGHSDADVALHALVDAILGAMAAGDIGDHFPPSDPQWAGADSARFVDHARALVAERGGTIDHVDLTIICEAPRIGPHREAIRTRIAGLLQVPVSRVSVKATTTERLGFTGRGEGIAAQAIATLRLPLETEV